MGRAFNPQTQKWESIAENNTPSSPSSSSSRSSSSSTSNRSQTSTPVSTYTEKSDGLAKSANKNFITEELTYLVGDAEVEPNSVTFATKAGNTVSLMGLGKHLSGLYFVTEVTTEITTSGLTLKYSVLKNGFGKTLKPYSETNNGTVDVLGVTDISVGDSVRFVEGVDAIYSNASDGVPVPEWVKQQSHTVSKLSDDKQRAYLQDINSWTYTKYLQKE